MEDTHLKAELFKRGGFLRSTQGWALSPDGKQLAIHYGSQNDYNGEIRIYSW